MFSNCIVNLLHPNIKALMDHMQANKKMYCNGFFLIDMCEQNY